MKNILLAFNQKAFLYLWIGEIFTQIAINLFNFLLLFAVFTFTKSNTAVSIAVLTITVPAILFGVLAGVYVDHWDKKKVLYTVNILRALLLIVLAFTYKNIYILYISSFFISILTQFFIPAESPLIPRIVKPKQLYSANALFGLAIYASVLIAFVSSGAILSYFGYFNSILFLSLLMCFGAFLLSFIHVSDDTRFSGKITKQGTKIAAFEEIHKALRIMSKTREINHSLFLLALSQILILIIATVAPGYAETVLLIPIENFPMLFVAPAALGVVVGTLVLTNMLEKTPKDRVINGGLFLSGIAMFALPFGSKIASRDFIIALNETLPSYFDITVSDLVIISAFMLGFANALVFVPANTILQEKTADEFRGKAYGVINTFVALFSLVPILAVGGLSDLVGVSTVLYGIGIILVVIGLLRVSNLI